MQRQEFSIEDISHGRTMTMSDLSSLDAHVFECNKVHAPPPPSPRRRGHARPPSHQKDYKLEALPHAHSPRIYRFWRMVCAPAAAASHTRTLPFVFPYRDSCWWRRV
jgi:hypothetical protein